MAFEIVINVGDIQERLDLAERNTSMVILIIEQTMLIQKSWKSNKKGKILETLSEYKNKKTVKDWHTYFQVATPNLSILIIQCIN